MPAAEQIAPLLSPDEAARILGVTRHTAYALARDGEIVAIRLGRGPRPRIRFEPAELERYIAGHRVERRA